MKTTRQDNSPRINQLFASMRYFSPIAYRDQDQLISQIRSYGKDILTQRQNSIENYYLSMSAEQIKYQTPQKSKSKIVIFDKTLGSTSTTKNLYDKYRSSTQMTYEKNLTKKKLQLVRVQSTKQNQMKDAIKVKHPNQRLYKKDNVNTLNYQKYTKAKAKRENQIKTQTYQLRKPQKQKTSYLIQAKMKKKNEEENKNKCFQRIGTKEEVQQCFINVVEKSQELKKRKIDKVNKLRKQEYLKEIQGVTFKPEKIAKKQLKSPLNILQRLVINQSKKQLFRNKSFKEFLQTHTFQPHTNTSKIKLNLMACQDSIEEQDIQIITVSEQNLKEKTYTTCSQIPIKDIKEVQFLMK